MLDILRGRKKVLSLVLIFILSMSLIVGCGKKEEPVKENKEETKVEAPVEEETTRIVTDMAGREHELPMKIEKVFTTSPVGTIALYSINPSLIAGLNSDVTELEEKYLTEEYTKLPVLGRYKASESTNDEEILKANPDIIISMGDINDRWIAEADEAQEKLGIPFLMISGDLDRMDETYEFLGDLLGEEEKCKILGDYARETIENTKKLASEIKEEDRVKVYYASTGDPLTTNVMGSIHTQAIDLIGAVNAAEVEVEKMSGGVEVSMEQVLEWDPDIIIAAQSSKGENSYETILSDDKWSTIKAVENKEVYGIPYAPFNWFDRPPSINRIIGVRWLGNLVYPEVFDIDIKQETKDFYKNFYHRELTDEEVDEILANAIR